jgi:hypothetical protein
VAQDTRHVSAAARATAPEAPTQEGALRRRAGPFIVWAFFASVFVLISFATLVQKTPAVDEPLHLFSGYAYLKWSDYRSNSVTPPVAKLWAALPLLAFDLEDPRPSRPHWHALREGSEDAPLVDIARDMFFVQNDGEPLFRRAKLQMVVLGVLLGAAIYVCASRLFGWPAGVAALALFTLDPTMLAHSQIVHGDVPFALWFFLATYFLWRFLERASWGHLTGVAVFAALAAATKFTYVALIPVSVTLAAVSLASGRPQHLTLGRPRQVTSRRGKVLLLALVAGVSAAAAWLTIWAAYGFHFHAIPGGLQPLPIQTVLPAPDSLLRPWVDRMLHYRLFPEAWIYGQLFVAKDLHRTAYLLGDLGSGFWLYFPVALAVKTPVPTLGLVALAVWLLATGRLDRRTGLFLLVPILTVLLAAVWSRMNVGIRHIAAIYPFVFVLAGGAAATLWRYGTRVTRGTVIVLALWATGVCAWTYPHYLAYFNELAGGSRNGHRVLLDSNLDWGQDLKGLKRWMDDHRVPSIQFLYFGSVDPEYYGIDATYIPGNWVHWDPPATQTNTPPRYIAISVHLLYTDWRDAYVRPYRQKTPVASIGHSIHIFEREDHGG